MKKKYIVPQMMTSHVEMEKMIATSVSSNLEELEYGGNASYYEIYEADSNGNNWGNLW